MGVARPLGGFDAGAIQFGGVGESPQFLQGLPAMEIGRAVVGVVGDYSLEFSDRSFQVAVVGVIEGQTVAREGVLGVLFEQGSQGIGTCTHSSMVTGIGTLKEDMAEELQGRPVRDSISEMSEFALPNDANTLGTLFGGKVMSLVDLAGSLAAVRHARGPVVTASVDYMTFLHPIHIGQLVILRSQVNRVFRTSMEVGVKVFVEDLRSREVKHTSSAYLTFVAIDKAGNRVPIAPVVPESEEELRRFEDAGERRRQRLEMKARTTNQG